MSQKEKEIAIHEFYLAANQFCKLMENNGAVSKHVFLSGMQKILSLVYLKASLMQKPLITDPGDSEKFVQEYDWNFIKDQISVKLGLSDEYIQVPLTEAVDPDNYESVTLSESMADIYQDLKDFSVNFEIGKDEAVQVALFYCIENFEKYWGIRALATLLTIHQFLYSDTIDDEDPKENEDDKTNSNTVDTKNWLINNRFNN